MGPTRRHPRTPGDRWWAMPLAVLLTGVAAGLVGSALTLLLHGVQHLALGSHGGPLDGMGDGGVRRRALAPLLVGLVVGAAWWWQRRAAPVRSIEAALERPPHRMRVPRTLADAALQIVAVAGGASVGREGAPRQSAAALASWLGARLALPDTRRRVLLAAGAGAGLAAVYDVPVTGALFAVETLGLASLGAWGLASAAVASGLAAVTAWPVVGHHPVYHLPPTGAAGLWWWVPLAALVCGLAGTLLRVLTDLARAHQPAPGPRLALAVTAAMALMGLVLAVAPDLGGNGKALLEQAFASPTDGRALALGAPLKILLTAVCMGAGIKGGLLTPALSVGGGLGLGAAWLAHLAGASASAPAFVVVGMVATLVASRRAPLVGVALGLELTHPPLVVVAAGVLAGLLAWAVDAATSRLRRA